MVGFDYSRVSPARTQKPPSLLKQTVENRHLIATAPYWLLVSGYLQSPVSQCPSFQRKLHKSMADCSATAGIHLIVAQ